jgi:MEMO1 family protein
MDRLPAVAGRFYPGSSESLAKAVESYLGPVEKPGPALGIIAPHAGYVYSGAVAGSTYAEVEVPDRVVVLCPNHTGLGSSRLALWPEGTWQTPAGDVRVDAELAAAIVKHDPAVKPDPVAHLREHALEVQLPFLVARNPRLKFVPIVLAGLSFEDADRLGKAIAQAYSDVGARPFIVASSDMSHYISAEQAKSLDSLAIDKAVSLDPKGLFRTVEDNDISMCGYIPATAMLTAARAHGAKEAKLVRYANSGDVTGDYDSVVGYAGVVVR